MVVTDEAGTPPRLDSVPLPWITPGPRDASDSNKRVFDAAWAGEDRKKRKIGDRASRSDDGDEDDALQ